MECHFCFDEAVVNLPYDEISVCVKCNNVPTTIECLECGHIAKAETRSVAWRIDGKHECKGGENYDNESE